MKPAMQRYYKVFGTRVIDFDELKLILEISRLQLDER